MRKWTWHHTVLVFGAFIIVVTAFQATGAAPGKIFEGMLGAVTTDSGWKAILARMTPLLVGGLAVFLGLRAGLFNIGAEGQILMGGLGTVLTVFAISNPLGLILGLVVGAIFGALWALPAGLIKAYRGGHEVISTIMLNAIAMSLCTFLAKGVLKDPGQQSATTANIAESAHLPVLMKAGRFELGLGWIIGLALVLGAAWWLKRSVAGYELEASGESPRAAEMAGIPTQKFQVMAMSASGALAGLAGAMLVTGADHRFYGTLAGGFGFDSLGVALLSGSSAWALIPSAFFFALVDAATGRLSFFGVPKGISALLLGLVILVFAALKYRKEVAK